MADTTNLIAGTAYATVDGTPYRLVGEMGYNPSIVSRESVSGPDGPHGYKEKPFVPSMWGTFRDMGGLSIADFNAMTNVTVVFELANGKTVIGTTMWTIDTQEVESDEGTFKVKWEGLSVVEA